MKIYADDPIKGKVLAGELLEKDGKKYLVKTVTRGRHFFNLVDGYALQRNLFLKLADTYEGIYIKEKDTKNTLYASMETWKLNGSNWTGKFGNQQTLSEKYMNKERSQND